MNLDALHKKTAHLLAIAKEAEPEAYMTVVFRIPEINDLSDPNAEPVMEEYRFRLPIKMHP